MKIIAQKMNIAILVMICLSSISAFAQPQLIWSTVASRLGTAESQTVLVACNGKVYQGIGNSNTNAWQEYDPSNNTWTAKTSMPGIGRNQCVGFSIGTKVYVGLGYDGTTPFPNDFYEYETTTDTWTSLGSWPLSDGIMGGFAWTINGKGYVGGGTSPSGTNALYEFDPSGNTWTVKAATPTFIQYTAAFVVNNKGYYACGWVGNGSNTAETYEYDPTNNTWSQKTNAPTAVRQTCGFALNNLGFVAGGYNYTSSVMQYDPSVNAWSSTTSLPAVSNESKATNIGSVAYLIQNKNTSSATNDFYKAEICNMPTVPVLSASTNSLCPGGSSTLSITSGSLNDATTWQWYTGSCGGTSAGTGTSISVTPSSSITYYVRGTGGCATNASCGNISVNVLSASISGTTSICQGASINLTITCNGTGPFSGTLSDGTSWSGSVSPITVSVSPFANTTYTIATFIANGSACPAAISGSSAIISVNGQAPLTTGGTTISPSIVNLSASGSGTLNWYDDPTAGNLVNTGTTYNPVVSTTTTYYVSNTENNTANFSIGRPYPSGASTSSTNRGLLFNVTSAATLSSVTVFPTNVGTGTIVWQTNVGLTMASVPYTINVGDIGTAKVITLNFALTPGTNYRLIKSGTGSFKFENVASAYPYSAVSCPVSISGSTFIPSTYYYFYDWQVQTGSSCTSNRTPVIATVTCPTPPVCENGGTVNLSCGCDCLSGYSGALCENGTYVFSGSGNWTSGTWSPANPGVSINTGSSITIPNGSTCTQDVAAITCGGSFTNNGIYKGTGTISGSVFINNGTLAPGNSPGCLNFTSGFISSGTVDIEVNGTSLACTDYDKITVSGTATLNGILNVTIGYSPTNGDAITFMEATTLSGTFAIINAPSNWSVLYDYPSTGQVTLSYTCTNPDVPTLAATVNPTCSGFPTTISIASGNLNSATDWQWYTGSCGGTSVGNGTSINVSPLTTTTYYARGEGGCVTPASCESITINVNAQPACQNGGTVNSSCGCNCPPGFIGALCQYSTTGPGSALNFDGMDDYISSSITTIPVGSNPRTMECWVKVNSFAYSNHIMGWGGYSSNQDEFRLSYDMYHRFFFWGNNADIASNSTITTGQWYHLAVSYDGADVKLYVNGNLEGTLSTNLVTASSDFTIGDSPIGWQSNLDGEVDEVRVWNRALCQSEIQHNMNCELDASGQTGLVALYHFNQGIASSNNNTPPLITLSDASGNSINGTLYNFALNGSTSNWVEPGAVSTGVSCGSSYMVVEATMPSISASSTSICNSSSTTLSIQSGSLNDATAWKWYSDNCGGTYVGSGTSIIVSPSSTTSYYVRGEGACVSPGQCGSITINVNNDTYSIGTNESQVCPGEPVSFWVNGNTSIVTSWNWNFDDGNTSTANPQNSNVSNTFPLTDPHTYHVTLHLTTNNICGSYDVSTDILVSSSAMPNAGFSISNNGEACPGDQLQYYPNDWNLSSYAWDFGDGNTSTQQNPNHIYTIDGDYIVSLTVTNSCGQSNTSTFTAHIQTNLQIPNWVTIYLNNVNNNAVCINEPIQFNSNYNTSSYAWDFGDPGSGANNTSAASQPTHSFSSAGTYTVSVILTNGCGNSTTISTTVMVVNNLVPSSPQIYVNGSIFCPNDHVSFYTNDNLQSYDWDYGDGSVHGTFNQVSHIYAADGVYTVTLTVTNYCGNTSSSTTTITIDHTNSNVPQISPGQNFGLASNGNGSYTGCIGDSLLFYAIGGIHYSWDFGDGVTTTQTFPINVNGQTADIAKHKYTANGTYTVTLTYYNGCENSSTASFPVTIGSNSSVSGGIAPLSNTYYTCAPINFIAFGGSTYTWDFGDGSSLVTTNAVTVQHAYSTLGTYSLTLIITNGCGTSVTYHSGSNQNDLEYVHVVAIPTPVVSISGHILTSTAAASYQWYLNGNVIATATSQTYTAIVSGNYVVHITDANGCTSSSAQVCVAIINEGSTVSVCPAGSVTLHVTGFTSGNTYLWSDAGATTSDQLAVAAADAGTYTVTVTSFGCVATTSVTIVVDNSLAAHAGNDITINFGQSTTLQGSGGGDYLWSSSSSLNCATCPNPVASPTTTTNYTLTVTGGTGCEATDEVLVTVCTNPDLPSVIASSDPICSGDNVTISIASGNLNSAADWQWYTGSCGGTSVGNGSSIIVSPNSTTTYYVRGEGGCVVSGLCTNYVVNVDPLQTWYLDADNDGYAVSSTQSCVNPGAGYNLTSTSMGDCDDNNNTVWQSGTFYIDMDGDGYDAGQTTVCYGSSLPLGYTSSTSGSDCDDNNNTVWQSGTFYIDMDGDGYDAGQTTVCYGSTLPSGYTSSTSGSDCDDNNNTVWQSGTFYIDMDGDGYDAGQTTVCYGSSVPSGYTSSTSGSDCNDNNNTVWQNGTFYIDMDGDGYDAGQTIVCYGSSVPSGYTSSTSGSDCNDNNNTVWQSGTFYIDMDGDGYDAGQTIVCYGSSVPSGYTSSTSGSDCNDNNNTVWQSGTFYIDMDGDGYDAGQTIVCYGSSVPSGYTSSTNGSDCDDNNNSVWQSIIVYIDQDMDGYDNGTTSICNTGSLPYGYAYSSNGSDCNDNNSSIQGGFGFYADTDGDGYGEGSIIILCAPDANTPPTGYSTNNTDCAPNDGSIWQYVSLYIDADGDGYDVGTMNLCIGSTIPNGYSNTSNGSDCNDNDNSVWISASVFIDMDADGYDAGQTTLCYGSTLPSGYSLTSNGTDCDDNNSSILGGYPFYADSDGDGYGAGSVVLLCAPDANTPPSGYSVNNTDCNDVDILVWQSLLLYIDNDGDGYDAGQQLVCFGASIPAGYSGTTSGSDCNDNNATVHNPSSASSSATACNTYTWVQNNNAMYTTSGAYVHTFTGAAGCDSVHTLHLTINNSNIGSSSTTACNTYTWTGTTYTVSGVYTKTFTNVAGCDSVHTLSLTINTTLVFTTCPSTINKFTSSNSCDTIVVYTASALGSPAPTYTYTFAGATTGSGSGTGSGSSFNKGTTTVTITATNLCGSVTCSFNVVVTDNILPTLATPGNQTLYASSSSCSANYTIADPITDNCAGSTWGYTLSGATTGSVSSITDGTNSAVITFNKGITTVTLSGVDAAAIPNSAIAAIFTITVLDTVRPIITCASNITVNNTAGLCSAPVTVTSPSVTDNCSQLVLGNGVNFDGVNDYATVAASSIINTADQAQRTVEVYFRVSDKNISSRKQVIWEEGASSNGLNIYVYNGRLYYGIYSITQGWSGVWLSTSSIQSGQWHNAVLVYDGTISNGRMKAYLDGTLIDSANASASLGTILSFHTGANAIGGMFDGAYFHDGSIAAGNNGNYFGGDIDEVRLWNIARTQPQLASTNTVQLAGNESGLVLYYNMDQGVACGNNSSITTLTDLTSTHLNATLTGLTLSGGCTSNFTNGSPALNSTITLTNSYTGTSNASGTYPKGTTNVVWTATDLSGNTATCTQLVTVNDTQAPTLINSGNQTFNVIANTCAANYTIPEPITDNCTGATWSYSLSGATTGTASGLADNGTGIALSFSKGVTLVTLNGVDASLNNATATTFSVTVNDNQAPTISGCPSNQTLYNSASACTAGYVIPSPTVSDNCTGQLQWNYTLSGVTTGSVTNINMGTNSSTITFNKGITTVSLSPVDASGNIGTACTFTVTVLDTIKPIITCSANVTINNTTNLCTGTTTLTAPTVSDNCSSVSTNGLSLNGTNNFLTTPDIKSFFTASTNMTIELWFNANAPGVIVDERGQAPPAGGWQDSYIEILNGGVVKVRVWNLTAVTLGSVSFGSWHHVALRYNASTSTLDGLLDGVPSGTTSTGGIQHNPQFYLAMGLGDSQQLGSGAYFNGKIDEVRVWNVVRTNTQITTNKDIEFTSAQTGLVAYYKLNQGVAGGTNTGITTATDASGNNNTGTLVNFALTGATSNWVAGQTFGVTVNNNAPATYPKGNTTVTWTATDASGNTATCNQIVTVLDAQAPTLANPGNQTLTTISNTCAATYTIADPITDNCTGSFWGYSTTGATTLSSSGNTIADGAGSGSLSFNKGVTVVTLTGTDGSNAATTTTFSVTVNDTQVPTISGCPTNQTLYNSASACTADYTISSPTVSDNCTGQLQWNYTLSGVTTGSVTNINMGTNSSTITFNKGITTVSLSPVDASGNIGTACTFTVTVLDTIKPIITCAANVTINNTTNLCTGTTTLTAPTVSDNCNSTLGNALDFDGSNDYLSFTQNISTVTNFTYESWVYPRSNAAWQRIFDFGNSAGLNIFFTSSYDGAGRPRFAINIGAGEQLLSSPNALTLNTWSHIALTLTGTVATMYINGVQVAQNTSYTYTPSSLGNTTNNWIGRSQYADPYFNGKLDEIRLWNVARTQAQIQANMNNELSAQSGLLAVYHLNQGTAGGTNTGINTATDASGNSRTGTLNNFALTGATSNWVGGQTFGLTATNNAPSTYPKGNTTVTWTATDASGNTATCNQIVTVLDAQAPTLANPGNQTFTAGPCTSSYTIADPITDNCTGSTWGYSTTGATTLSSSGNTIADGVGSGLLTFNIGTTVVTLTGTDGTNAATNTTFTVTVNAPEMNVKGNNTNIVDGSVTSSSSNWTDFGANTYTRTFTIQNTGTISLSLSGTSVTGTNASEFAITTAPQSSVAVSGSTTFIVTFTPSGLGVRTATIHITNNDCDEADYDFVVQGTSIAAEALAFDGTDDYVSLANPSSFDFSTTSQFSIEAWIKANNAAANDRWILSKISSSVVGYGLQEKDGKIRFVMVSNFPSNILFVETPNLNANDGSWHHVAVTYDGSATSAGVKIYVDGVSQTLSLSLPNTLTTSNSINNSDPVWIGRANAINSPFIGAIDEVRVWGRVLCQPEIQAQRNCEIPTIGKDLIANYHFNHGIASGVNTSVTTLTDATGNGNNGTLNNFALTGSVSNWIAPGAVSTGTSCPVYLDPEININGNNVSILDGDSSPSTSDYTDFGPVPVSLSHTFTIENTGNSTLNISGVSISGTNSSDFTVSSAPASTVLANGSTTFTILFTPSSLGLKTATMHINNDDCNEADYDIAIQGTGSCVAPTISCPGNQSVNAAPSACYASVSYTSSSTGNPAPSISYSFSGATTGSGNGDGSGSSFNIGNTIVTLTATNPCGTQSCTFTVTVVNTTATSTTVSQLGCYIWIANNVTYTVSGVYVATLTNAAGCDSVSTLHLTITPGVYLSAKALLQGPYVASVGLMHDSLRVNHLIPNMEPYSGSPYNKMAIGDVGNETVSNTVLQVSGNNAIVDWVFIELRSASNPATVLANKRALIQRDGDIVSTDGVSPVYFSTLVNGQYYVTIKHRNHLGIMSASALNFNGCSSTAIDFTTSTPVYVNPMISNAPRKVIDLVYTLWSADANNNKNVKYNGLSNDKDFLLSVIGSSTPNNSLHPVYRMEDVNMDGKVNYNNTDNDRNVILTNIGVSTPNSIIYQHTPN